MVSNRMIMIVKVKIVSKSKQAAQKFQRFTMLPLYITVTATRGLTVVPTCNHHLIFII